MSLEADVRYRIDKTLENKGWVIDPDSSERNVYLESALPSPYRERLQGTRPDYTLFNGLTPVGVIEAKKPNSNLSDALEQATQYAEKLDAPLVFAVNGTFCKTRFLHNGKELYLNGDEVKELLRVKDALKFVSESSNEVYTVPKEVIKSRQELIRVFAGLNDILRGEGLRAGIERFSEFANILFLKLLSEQNETSYWQRIKEQNDDYRIDFINDTILRQIVGGYGGDVFSKLLIRKPKTLKTIIDKLDPLYLNPVDEDIKGGAFEYFLEKTTSTQNDLGEYYTPRHVVRSMVQLVDPRFGEKIYDPFCGTGGFLTESFRYVRETSDASSKKQLKQLRENTIYGRELTTTARIAKMNMILYGDGHSGVEQGDSLETPRDGLYDAVITNIPFSQKVSLDTSNLYEGGLAKKNGDCVCMLHCYRSLKEGGRMAVVVPEGFLFRRELKNVRQFFMENAKLHSIVSLPQGVFLPYTGVKTNIVYFTDVKKKTGTQKYWHFKIENDGYSLDSHRRKLDGESDLDKLSAVDFDDTNEFAILGFRQVEVSDIQDKDYNLTYVENTPLTVGKYDFVKLGDVCDLYQPRTITQKELILEGKYPVYGANGLIGRYDLFNHEKPEVIMTCRGATCGTINVSEPFSWITGNAMVCSPKQQEVIWKKYLYFILAFSDLASVISGSAQPQITKSSLEKFSIPLPPIEIQQQIVEQMESYQKIIDGARQVVENYTPTIDIDPSWEVVALGDVCEITMGQSPSSEFYNKNADGLEFHQGKTNFTDMHLGHSGIWTSQYNKIAEANSILMSVRAPVGPVNITERKIALGRGLCGIKPNGGCNQMYLYYILKSSRERLAPFSRGSTFKSINRNQLLDFKIPIPPIEVQQKIVTELEELHKIINGSKKLIEIYTQKIADRTSRLWTE